MCVHACVHACGCVLVCACVCGAYGVCMKATTCWKPHEYCSLAHYMMHCSVVHSWVVGDVACILIWGQTCDWQLYRVFCHSNTVWYQSNEYNAGSLALVYTTVAYMALDALGGSVVVQVNPWSGSSWPLIFPAEMTNSLDLEPRV